MNLFTVSFLLASFVLTVPSKSQTHQTVKNFEETDFYTYFHFKLEKQVGNRQIYKPGAFQDLIELQVDVNSNTIDKMVLSIDRKFITSMRLLAADMLKSFVLLHAEKFNDENDQLFKILSNAKEHTGIPNYYYRHIYSVFTGRIPIFVIPFGDLNYTMIFENIDNQLITTVQANKNVAPIEKTSYSFIDEATVRGLNPRLKLKEKTSPNEKTWLSETGGGGCTWVTQLQYPFKDSESAILYFLQSFEELTEKGQVESAYSTDDKKRLGRYAVISQMDFSDLDLGKAILLCFVRENTVHKLMIITESGRGIDEIMKLAEKIKP